MIEAKLLELQPNLQQHPTIEWVPVNSIGIDMTYQRLPGPTKIKMIANKFNQAALGVLIVSQRENGEYYVIDGQHRLEAMKKRGVVLAECKVVRGITVEQEAEIYIHCNTVRKNPEALDVFRARLVNQDPIAITITEIVEKYGLYIQYRPQGKSTTTRDPHAIWAIASIEDIYIKGKEKLLSEVLTLITRTWPDNGGALESRVLQGVAEFHLKYQGRYTREEFTNKLKITDILTIRRRAGYLAENNRESMVKSIARALQEAYDKGRRHLRLEPK